MADPEPSDLSPPDLSPDVWRTRLVSLTLVRLVGIAVAFVGLVWASTDRFGATSPIGGGVLVVLGLVGSLWLARVMRRRWLPPA